MVSLAPADALELPVDEVALHVLEDMIRISTWNSYNYCLQYASDETYRKNGQAALCIAEGLSGCVQTA